TPPSVEMQNISQNGSVRVMSRAVIPPTGALAASPSSSVDDVELPHRLRHRPDALPADREVRDAARGQLHRLRAVALHGHGAGEDVDYLAAGHELPSRGPRVALPGAGDHGAILVGELHT